MGMTAARTWAHSITQALPFQVRLCVLWGG